MGKITVADVLEMPVAERILLVEDIWDSITALPEAIQITAEQRDELERRLRDYHAHPEASQPWDEVKRRIRKPE